MDSLILLYITTFMIWWKYTICRVLNHKVSFNFPLWQPLFFAWQRWKSTKTSLGSQFDFQVIVQLPIGWHIWSCCPWHLKAAFLSKYSQNMNIWKGAHKYVFFICPILPVAFRSNSTIAILYHWYPANDPTGWHLTCAGGFCWFAVKADSSSSAVAMVTPILQKLSHFLL